MPSANLSVVNSPAGTQPSAANTVVVMGTCAGGTNYTLYECSSEKAAIDAGTSGPAVELACAIIRGGRRVMMLKVNGTVAGAFGAVSAPGGPTITVAGAALDTIAGAVKITKGGALGTAQAQFAADYRLAADGTDLSTYGPVFELPSPPQATLVGTVDLTTLTLADLNGTTLKIDEDSTTLQTVNLTTPSSVADIATQINAGTTNVTATIENNRLVLKSDTLGASSTISIDATSTADTIVGVSGSAAGAASTYAPPNTGATLTFAVGTYVLDQVYTFAGTQPFFSTTELDLAYAALYQANRPFGGVVLANECIDAANALVFVSAISTQQATAATTYKRYARALLGIRPSTTDALVKNTITSATVAARVAVCPRGAYMPGTALKGNIKRGAQYVAAMRYATGRFSSDLGNGLDGPLSEVVALVGASTGQEDEALATVKLRDYRFTVLETRAGLDGFYFSRGITLADSSTVYTDLNMARLADEGCRLLQPELDRLVNADFIVNADGTIDEAEALSREERFDDVMKVGLLDPDPPHAVRAIATVDRANVIGTNNDLKVSFTIQKKAQGKTVTATLGVVSTIQET